MKDLIEALQIFLKYTGDHPMPTQCDEDLMYIGWMDEWEEVTETDLKRLNQLSFYHNKIGRGFHSDRFGSC
jgi:hypothetical protein